MEEISVIQDKPAEVFSYAWAPDRDYFSPRHRPGHSFRSRTFASHKHRNLEWALQLYPQGRTDPNFVSVYLELLPKGKSVVAKCKFAFLSYAGIEIKADGLAEFRCRDTMTHFSDLYGYDMGEHDFGENNKCGAEKSVNQFFILHGLSKSRYAPLTTCCEITVLPTEMVDIKIPACRLSNDLGALLVNGDFSDVTLTTTPEKTSNATLNPDYMSDGVMPPGDLTGAMVNFNKLSDVAMETSELTDGISDSNKLSDVAGTSRELTGVTTNPNQYSEVPLTTNQPMAQVFHAHKAILCARSQVFKAMFSHDLRERQNGHVIIKDMSTRALKGMLEFIYTGTVQDLEGQAEELLAAAEKYALGRLKIMCEHYLSKHQTTENITHILVLADLYNANNLWTHAIKFMKRNSNEVMKTTAWKTLISVHPELAIGILTDLALVDQNLPSQVFETHNTCV